MVEKFYYKSPIGILEIITHFDRLTSLKITDNFKNISDTDFSLEIKRQLSEYFCGKRKIFNINILPMGTDFQNKVWAELCNISYASTKTYNEIAVNIGNRNAQRAVGNACNKNPIMIIIPCHRVINKNGKLSGFAYGTDIKQKLLTHEKEYQM